MITGELLAKVGRFISDFCFRDGINRLLLDDHVWRDDDDAAEHLRERRSVKQRNGAAVAVSDEPHTGALGGVDLKRIEEGGQHIVRLPVHEIDRPFHVMLAWRRTAIAWPRIHEAAKAEPVAERLRPVLPQRDGA